MKAFLPALLVAVFAGGCGTFFGGTGAWESTVAFGILLPLAALSQDPLNPLRLGPWGQGALALLFAACVLSWWLSPVPRAGRTVVLLLPAFVLLPGALAVFWKSEGARRRGLGGLSLVVTAVSLWALADRLVAGTAKAAMPLGHHNLLAIWLVTLLPLAALEGRNRGAPRWLAVAAAVTGTAALVATGSLAGTAALALQIALAWILLKTSSGRRPWLLGGLVFSILALLPALPRLSALLAGTDASWASRRTYLAAGWQGLWDRPGLGWGPGSTAWTASDFLEPKPGVNLPGELVGDLHNLPLQIFYELGIPAGLGVLFLLALLLFRRTPESKDPPLVAASKLGLAGFLVASLGGAPLGVSALPVALAVAVSAGFAADSRRPRPRSRWLPAIYALGAAALLIPSQAAHHAYERAAKSEDPLSHLETALGWDPHFPLYRAQLAIHGSDPSQALSAAEDGESVAALWLLAASLGGEQGASWASEAAERACDLDPLSAMPPYLFAASLFAVSPGPPGEAEDAGVEAMARAVLADPRLLATPKLLSDRLLLRRVMRRIQRQKGLEEGLRVAWREMEEVLERSLPEGGAPTRESLAVLRQGMDGEPSLALSVFLFRRRPWPVGLARAELDSRVLSAIELPPATALSSTAPWVFRGANCSLQELGGASARSQ